MWSIVYLVIGILYCYLLDVPLYNRIAKSNIEMFLLLAIMDIFVFIGIQLYNKLFKDIKKIKWYQLIIGMGVSAISLLFTMTIRFIFGMQGM